jgi:hypothetical protein
MAITKSEILTAVNKICKRAETDIDDILLEALQEISNHTLCLKTSTTGNTTAGVAYIAKPTGFNSGNIIDGLVVNDVKIKPISWQQYLSGDFDGYCVYGDYIYIYPTNTSAVAYTIYFPRIHPSDLDSILFSDDYRAAVKHLTAAKLYEKYERYEEVSAQLTLYEVALSKVGTNQVPPICSYNGQEM